jgi:hypothetical protein
MVNRIEKLEKKNNNKSIVVNNNILNNNCNNKTLNICQPGSEDVKLQSKDVYLTLFQKINYKSNFKLYSNCYYIDVLETCFYV